MASESVNCDNRTVSAESIVDQFNYERAKIKASPSDLPVATISSWVKNEVVDISPGFQRRERWDEERRSQLIESFLMKIPVPPVYLFREADGPYSVIDGKQRITAIHSFVDKDMVLKGLKRLTLLEGLTYKDLPNELKRQLDVEPALRAVVVDADEVEESTVIGDARLPLVKYEVFHRLNTGGIKLEPQEIRNAIYRGKLNDLIAKLAENEFLQEQMKAKPGTKNYEKMRDQEFVLRFLMMREFWENVPDNITALMDKFMQENQHPTDGQLAEFSSDFGVMIDRAKRFFAETAFRNWNPSGGWRDQQNVAVYDAQAIAVWSLSEEEFEHLMRHRDEKLEQVRGLFTKNHPFAESISGTTGSKKAVRTRVSTLLNVLKG